MLNININYPYPVIREYADDFTKTIFLGELAVRLEPDGYSIHPSFKIDNNEIDEMISEGSLTYAIEIQCVSTWYRKLYEIHDNNIIKLNPQEVHDRVEIIPCIIAKSEINDYSNSDFAEEYLGMKFEVNIGDVIGIGEKRTFDALYQNDIIKNGSSIVSISGSDANKEIYCDFNGSVINIMLPLDQYENYKDCGYNKVKYKMLNAILTIPALVEAIGIVKSDENDDNQTSGFETKSWYKTIVANLKRYAENDETKYQQLLDKPFAAAELLLGNNSAKALDFLSQLD
ncbi:hypothetical protein [Robinsoniella peoriensis]|uniref:hypothetical protein n=1 Tax=Robinsoniella peoriensis TaxID=180332 RepID=UPI003752DCAA